jgi:hypothetical protein
VSPNSGSAAPSASVRAACLNDAKKFCASVLQNDEARRRCMTEHTAELSEGCKAAVAAERRASGKGDNTANVNRCLERCVAASPGARASFKCGEACATGRYQRPSGY